MSTSMSVVDHYSVEARSISNVLSVFNNLQKIPFQAVS